MGSEWTAERVRNIASICLRGSDAQKALLTYAAILGKQASAEPFGYVATDADTFVKHWHGMTKPSGFLAVYTHPPAQPAIAAELDDYKNAILHAADDCTAKHAEIKRLQSRLAAANALLQRTQMKYYDAAAWLRLGVEIQAHISENTHDRA